MKKETKYNKVIDNKRAKLEIINPKKEKQLLKILFEKSSSYSFGVRNKVPFFVLTDENLVLNRDKSITWKIRDMSLGFHVFLGLVTGEGERRKKVHIPFCLVNPRARELITPLLATTIDPRDGRLNTKDAEAVFFGKNGIGVKIKFRPSILAIHWVAAQLLPQNPYWLASEYCAFCREFLNDNDNRRYYT